MAAMEVKVAIIGAGMAGAAAAERLYHAGLTDIVVLEAMERVGGRAHTLWLNQPEHEFQREKVEIGANWIHHIIDNPIYDLACQHCAMSPAVVAALTRRPNIRPSVNMGPSGQVLDKRTVKEVNKKISQALNKACNFYFQDLKIDQSKDMDLRTFLDQELQDYFKQFDGDELTVRRDIFENRMLFENNLNGCHDMNEVSALQSGSYKEFDGPEVIIPAGFQNVVIGMLKDIPPEKILLKHPVKNINTISDPSHEKPTNNITNGIPVESPNNINQNGQNNNMSNSHVSSQSNPDRPCTILCANGQLIYADYIIFTGSLNVLKAQGHSLFTPSLPAAKLQAIGALGMGVVDKIFLQFDNLDFLSEGDFFKLFPDRQNLKGLPMEQLWLRKIPMFSVEPTSSGNILTFWISGDEAIHMESLTDVQVKEGMMSLLKDFLQREIPEPIRVIRTQWHSNPYVLGSYSYIATNSTTQDIRELAKPVTDPHTGKPVLLFAGEATHDEFYSTTHGAVFTGRREAERILDQEGLLTTTTPNSKPDMNGL